MEGAALAERADQNGLNTLLDLPNRMKACWGLVKGIKTKVGLGNIFALSAYGDRPISLVTCFTRISCSFLGQNQASCLRKTGNVQNFLDKMRPILTGMLGGLQG